MIYDSRITAVLGGLVAHHAIFIKGEWHLLGPAVFVIHVLLLLSAVLLAVLKHPEHAFTEALSTSALGFWYCVGLFGSITIYRLFFHRLRNFPGPKGLAVSKLWHVWKTLDSRNHLYLDVLYKKYGPFVRTGPEEITIYHPAAFELLDGVNNSNTRSDWYDVVHPRISPIFSRDETDHVERRRIWSQALSTKSIREYLPRILRQIATLDQVIADYKSEPLLLNDVMQWFAFDSMGEFAFNETFGMMASGKWHHAAIQQRSALALLGPFTPAIWTARFGFAFLPFFGKVKDWMGMISFCDSRMEKRIQTGDAEPDMAAFFIKEYKENRHSYDPVKQQLLLSGNTVSVIVGGSDTTGPSLILLWYFLAKYPNEAEKTYQELLAHSEDISNPTGLANLPHLNGVINESMRLIPASLSVALCHPREGLHIDDVFIPGGVKINAPRYTIFRMPEAFGDPESFVPERWYSKPEMIRDRRTFAPFSVGRRSCVGKNLALTQIRLVVATLLFKYQVRFADGEDGVSVERDMRDQMTAQAGKCRVVFEPR